MTTFIRMILTAATLAAAAISDANATAVPVANETCFTPQENCDERMMAFLGSATQTLDIAIYSITHRGIAQALLDAKARGIKIRIVCDKGQAEIKSSQVDELNNAGLNIHFGGGQGLMHDKYTIVDGRMIETGSFNYTWAATKYNSENQIYLDTPQVVRRYSTAFEELWGASTKVPDGFVGNKAFEPKEGTEKKTPPALPGAA